MDAGLQYSTTFGNWSPFFAVSRPSTTSPTGSEKSLYIPKASINPVGLPSTGDAQLRLDAGQTFTLEVWTTDTEIVIKIAPIGTGTLTWRVAPNGVVVMNSQTRYFKYAVGVTDISGRVAPAAENPASLGWTTAGTGQSFKAMTTIAQPLTTLTNPFGNTNFDGVKWVSTVFGNRSAAGAVTPKVTETLNPQLLKKCAYPSEAMVVVGGNPLNAVGDTVRIKYVGPSVANITPLSFVFRGKPGDPSFDESVTIKNTGPVGSLLYWCKQASNGTCDIFKTYSTNKAQPPRSTTRRYLAGINGGGNEKLKVSNVNNVAPACATDPAQTPQTGSFKINYQTSAATGTSTINYKVKCVAMTFAWFDDPSITLPPNEFNGPQDLCHPMAAVINVKSNLPLLSSADLVVKVDTTVIPSNQLSFFAGPSANDITVLTNNHCNYSEGGHTLSVTLNDIDDATKTLASVSGTFTITDNRWTWGINNLTNNCAGVAGGPIVVSATAAGEANQTTNQIPVGQAGVIYLRGGKAYTVNLSSTVGVGGTFSRNFPTDWGLTLPVNISYQSVGGVLAHVVSDVRITPCPAARSSVPAGFVLEDKPSSTRWTIKDGKLVAEPKP